MFLMDITGLSNRQDWTIHTKKALSLLFNKKEMQIPILSIKKL